MKQIKETFVPPYLTAFTHQPTSDFLSNPYPRLGERLTFWLRAPQGVVLKQAILCTRPNGAQLYTAMQPTPMRDGFAFWECSLSLNERLNAYYFMLVTQEDIWWLDALGVHQNIPLLAHQFKLLTDQAVIPWLEKAVFYQIFPDRFANGDASNDPHDEKDPITGGMRSTFPWGQYQPYHHDLIPFYGGDLKGVEDHLGYLDRLGINAVFLNPIFSAWTNHRYDVRDYFEVDSNLGGNEALVSLAKGFRRHKMRYVLDIVPNHTGLGHPWFLKAREDAHSEEAGFYYFSTDRKTYSSWMGFKSLPKLNYRSQALRDKIYGPQGVFSYWLKPPFEADGWRVDVGNMLGRHYEDQFSESVIKGIRQRVKATKAESYLFGENFYEAASQLQGEQWDGVMNYMGFSGPLVAWLKPFATGEIGWEGELQSKTCWKTESLVKAWMEHLAAIPWAVALQQYNLLSGHDTPRIKTVLKGDDALVRLAYTILFTFPGIPSVFYGDEIGLENQKGFDSRVCMPWDEKDWDKDFFSFLQGLIKLRKENVCLAKGAFQILCWEDDLLIYQRELDGKHVLVTANRSDVPNSPKPVPVPESGIWLGTFRAFGTEIKAEVKESVLYLPALPKGALIWF
ncbi:MAG: alpha-amylase family glycosyl hydrolase [Anaerolineaceae bacterium]|nr:alpha-amylase family glycosyl hydrolase [Anaerolineaceae bacterium]